jgi:hypothetical protein
MIVNATDAPGAIEADLLAEISSLYDGFTINGGDNIADLHSGRSGRSAPLIDCNPRCLILFHARELFSTHDTGGGTVRSLGSRRHQP